MIRVPIFAFTLSILAGCAVSSNLPEEKAAQIPEGSNTIFLVSDLHPDSLYVQAHRLFTSEGMTFREDNSATRRIVTLGKDIGQYTTLSITMRVGAEPGGSRLEALGQWSQDPEEGNMATVGQDISAENTDWERAAWQVSPRGTRAFGEMVLLLEKLPHREVRYMTN